MQPYCMAALGNLSSPMEEISGPTIIPMTDPPPSFKTSHKRTARLAPSHHCVPSSGDQRVGGPPFISEKPQANRSVCPFHHCVPSPGDQPVGGPHSSHPFGAARYEDYGYDQGYLQEVMSVDVHPNN